LYQLVNDVILWCRGYGIRCAV